MRVEPDQIARFAATTGETNPMYFDEQAARAAGHPAIPAPPTFGWTLRLLTAPMREDIEALGVRFTNVLHGEEAFSYLLPIYAGDTIRLKTRVADIYERKGGALEFIVQETAAYNHGGRLVQTMRTVLVVQNDALTCAR